MPRVPLQISKIDEGRFLKLLDGDLEKAVSELMEFVRLYPEHAEGAKAAVTAKVSLACESSEAYSVKTQVKIDVPGRPANVTMAIHEITQSGEEFLTVKPSGSDHNDPRQGKLCTDDGRGIDPETGQVLDG